MGRAEQRCLEEVKLRYDKNEIRYYGISIEEQQQLHVLIDTAQDTDGETTTFPDFIGENGWIEHFQVSSSKCNRKGNENNRKIASINRAIDLANCIKEVHADTVSISTFYKDVGIVIGVDCNGWTLSIIANKKDKDALDTLENQLKESEGIL